MFSIAHLVKVHHDLWPWMTSRGHVKVTNVKIANIFLMVRAKHVVTMKHLWEVDIELSESVTKFDPGWPWRRHFKVTKVKIERGVITVAPRPLVSIDKTFTIAHLVKVRHDLWPWVTFRGHLKVTTVKIANPGTVLKRRPVDPRLFRNPKGLFPLHNDTSIVQIGAAVVSQFVRKWHYCYRIWVGEPRDGALTYL